MYFLLPGVQLSFLKPGSNVNNAVRKTCWHFTAKAHGILSLGLCFQRLEFLVGNTPRRQAKWVRFWAEVVYLNFKNWIDPVNNHFGQSVDELSVKIKKDFARTT